MKNNRQLLKSLIILIVILVCLNSCTPYAQAGSYRMVYPGYERHNIDRMAQQAMIGIGGAYAIYNIIQHRNMASQPLPQPYRPPQLWKCFATVTWAETQLSARESYVGPVHQHINYALAHTAAYKHCKALGATFANGCRVTCFR